MLSWKKENRNLKISDPCGNKTLQAEGPPLQRIKLRKAAAPCPFTGNFIWSNRLVAFVNSRFLLKCPDSEISNINTVRDMVNHNIGVAFIPESIIDRSLDIAYFSIEPKLAHINGLICRSTLGFTEEEQHFIDLVEQHPLFKA